MFFCFKNLIFPVITALSKSRMFKYPGALPALLQTSKKGDQSPPDPIGIRRSLTFFFKKPFLKNQDRQYP